MIKTWDGETPIELQGFNINGEIVISDSDSIKEVDEHGNEIEYEKVRILLTPSMLDFLISDRGLLEKSSLDITVWWYIERSSGVL